MRLDGDLRCSPEHRGELGAVELPKAPAHLTSKGFLAPKTPRAPFRARGLAEGCLPELSSFYQHKCAVESLRIKELPALQSAFMNPRGHRKMNRQHTAPLRPPEMKLPSGLTAVGLECREPLVRRTATAKTCYGLAFRQMTCR